MRRAALGRRGRRWLYLIHRWIGIATCLLFLVWFVSGLVMVYVPYPSLTPSDRLAGLPAIDWTRVRIDPDQAGRAATGQARRATTDGRPPASMLLEMMADEPVWRVRRVDDADATIDARTGARLVAVDARQAAAIAHGFDRRAVASVDRLTRDQWTVAGGFDAHRPLFRVRMAGEDGRDLYVSGTTGAIVQDTARRERFWNWLGSVPHWIYPTILRRDDAAWRQVVLWVSGPCILVAITGMWIGLLRTRAGSRRFKGGRMTPYRGWMLWHHVAGLAGGATLLLWIVSGWLSVDPGHLFRSAGLDPMAEAAYGAPRYPVILDPTNLAAAAGTDAKRVTLKWAAGRPWIIVDRERGSDVFDARTLSPSHANLPALLEAVRRLMPEERVRAVQRLEAPDLYWYDVGSLPPLPVLRVKFADRAGTWVHVDPVTGELLGTLDRRRRLYRWAFDLFHKWDLNALTRHRPAWDVVLWALSLAGIVTSASGLWIGWRRLRPRSASAMPASLPEARA